MDVNKILLVFNTQKSGPQLDPQLLTFFSKIYYLEKRGCRFVTFTIIICHIFPEIPLVVQKI